jgi:hypothetical protein
LPRPGRALPIVFVLRSVGGRARARHMRAARIAFFRREPVVHTWTHGPTGRPDMIRTSETLV